jgi:hypothetical protein
MPMIGAPASATAASAAAAVISASVRHRVADAQVA